MKRQLMIIANALRKQGFSLSQSLKRAWAVIRLKAEMLIKPVSFFYRKDDGSERFAVGYYGSAPAVAETSSKPGAVLAIRYYDTLAMGWRSFRADRLILA